MQLCCCDLIRICCCMQLYEVEGRDPKTAPVERTQWLSYGRGPGQLLLQGQKLLIVDEVREQVETAAAAAGVLLRACVLTVCSCI
jgi:hypoxanthine phosphoribosyltransferase